MLYVDRAKGESIKLRNNTTTNITLSHMAELAAEYVNDPFIISRAQELLRFSDPVQAVFDYVYGAAVYREDKEKQNLKTPFRLMSDKTANCVQYSIFISSLLSAMGIKHYFRSVDQSGDGDFTHVYVKTMSGQTLDATLGQPDNDLATFWNRNPKGFYNKEVEFVTKIDKMPELVLLNSPDYNGYASSVMNQEVTQQSTGFSFNPLNIVSSFLGGLSCYDQCGVTHPWPTEGSRAKKEECRDLCRIAAHPPPPNRSETFYCTVDNGRCCGCRWNRNLFSNQKLNG